MPILNIPTHPHTFEEAVQQLQNWAEGTTKTYVSLLSVHTVMCCQDDPEILQAVQQADMVAADGMPLVWWQRWRGYPLAERLYGPDLLLALCEQGQATGLRHYFWGGGAGIAPRLAESLQARYPALQIAGTYTPAFGSIEAITTPESLNLINQSGAQVVWVGLGSPKQDAWMARYRAAIDAPLLVGVGAAFDFLSGSKRQAPLWMQRNGLEWLFRLSQEPRRLGYRYLVNNPRFVWAWLKHMAKL